MKGEDDKFFITESKSFKKNKKFKKSFKKIKPDEKTDVLLNESDKRSQNKT